MRSASIISYHCTSMTSSTEDHAAIATLASRSCVNGEESNSHHLGFRLARDHQLGEEDLKLPLRALLVRCWRTWCTGFPTRDHHPGENRNSIHWSVSISSEQQR